MKKLIPIFAVLLACTFQISASAASGSIEIEVPKEAGKVVVSYGKTAEWEETRQEEFTGTPKEEMEYEKWEEFEAGEKVKLENLEPGIYQLQITGNEEYEFSPIVVSIPMWNEELKRMEYEIQVIPKYVKHVPVPELVPETPEMTSPVTADGRNWAIYGIFGMFSLLIVIMSCHKRFKCARMSE